METPVDTTRGAAVPTVVLLRCKDYEPERVQDCLSRGISLLGVCSNLFSPASASCSSRTC